MKGKPGKREKKRTFNLVIDGVTVLMEMRKCPGCRAYFKVKTGSPQEYHSFLCEAEHKKLSLGFNFYYGVEAAPALPKSGKFEVEDED
jgi:hypothetical protein